MMIGRLRRGKESNDNKGRDGKPVLEGRSISDDAPYLRRWREKRAEPRWRLRRTRLFSRDPPCIAISSRRPGQTSAEANIFSPDSPGGKSFLRRTASV